MRRIVLVVLFVTFGTALAGETKMSLNYGVAEGVIVDDNQGLRIFYEYAFPNQKREADFYIIFETGRVSRIGLTPIEAQKLAEEIEPYVMLQARGKSFEENHKLNDHITVDIISGDVITVLVKHTEKGREVSLSGKAVEEYVKGFLHADEVAYTWLPVFSKSFDHFAGQHGSQKASEKAVAVMEETIKLSDVSSAYSDNELAGDKKYGTLIGKPVVVSGTVRNVSIDHETGQPRILFNQAIRARSISCLLDATQIDDATNLQVGQTIIVSGIWNGRPELLGANIIKGKLVK